MSHIRRLLFNWFGVFLGLFIVAFGAYIAIAEPAWVVDPLRDAASDVLGGMGVAIALPILWSVWAIWLLSRGFRRFLAQWRYLIGVGFLVAGAFAVLSYFQTSFPLIGRAPLGGEVGEQLRGAGGVLGVVRTSIIVIVGAWFLAPALFATLLRGTGRSSLRAQRAIARMISERRRPSVESELSNIFSERSAPEVSPSTLTPDLQAGAMAFAANARVTPSLGSSLNGNSLNGALSSSPARQVRSSGLAYLEPTAPRATSPKTQPVATHATDEHRPPLWPGLVIDPPEPEEAPTDEQDVAPNGAFSVTGDPDMEASVAEAMASVVDVLPGTGVPFITTASAPISVAPAESAWPEVCTDDDTEPLLAASDAAPVAASRPYMGDLDEMDALGDDLSPTPDPVQIEPIHFELPDLSLLAPVVSPAAITQEHLSSAAVIEETLADHGVEVSVSEIRPGPSVTMFGLVPGWNRKAMSARARALAEQEAREVQLEVRNRVKVDSILAREKDLALALAAPSLRIQAPVPGESIVGVEVPNKSSSMVTIRTVMESPEYNKMVADGGLPVALGLASAGEPVVIDLTKMPHLLIAGATGSGKSVCINTIISSIITHQDPAKVRMVLVDPKRVELTPYNGIPHLVTPVVVDPDKVVRLLRGAIEEMMRRYKLLEEAGARNILSYHQSARTVEKMPYFVICIDELADLMMTASFDVEQSLCRLAQLGRATGIHLIVATQRPSVNVLTGLIKANFPSRIAFAVPSQIDSRTIIDAAGAERLLGRGDMLFLSSDAPKPRRVQGVFISEDETAALSEHWRQLPINIDLPVIPLEELAREAEVAAAESTGESADFDETDSLYDRALQLATSTRQLSTSLLQRRLRIGYPRAARLMDQLEEEGIVAGTSEPGKPREVIYLPSDE